MGSFNVSFNLVKLIHCLSPISLTYQEGWASSHLHFFTVSPSKFPPMVYVMVTSMTNRIQWKLYCVFWGWVMSSHLRERESSYLGRILQNPVESFSDKECASQHPASVLQPCKGAMSSSAPAVKPIGHSPLGGHLDFCFLGTLSYSHSTSCFPNSWLPFLPVRLIVVYDYFKLLNFEGALSE